MSDYVEGVAIKVAILSKVKDSASVFCRYPTGGGSDRLQITPHEFYRFFHSILSTILTRTEPKGVHIIPKPTVELHQMSKTETLFNIHCPKLKKPCKVVFSTSSGQTRLKRIRQDFVDSYYINKVIS
ncbi:unnamed protein product [Arabis nemorensis]|uniref:DUF3444 domain-containing protein n=1 Tax=Arabis nemorensis TaxID=586526 RepID=A0A565CUV6_9BRAS|nr:unnamed protein product [Arabis nemorensis]